ncbi:hypothetical protein EH165_03645 [Nakamurella antarctica]|uniref:Uncharacterized protein n=1 Tax=Nakamurella antarctica TaxID=1902245 RepID=A0A3G8ZKS9_9ACTN|nr:hypothetical protein [Nakamurella antarctica]AZI57387.1 hypothetical protein EH165_03645 [Nakamurella antarctica]
MTLHSVLSQIYLAAPQPGDFDPNSGKGPEFGKAAPVALLIVVILAVALYFLIKSMGRQLKKVPPAFEASEALPQEQATEPHEVGGATSDFPEEPPGNR